MTPLPGNISGNRDIQTALFPVQKNGKKKEGTRNPAAGPAPGRR